MAAAEIVMLVFLLAGAAAAFGKGLSWSVDREEGNNAARRALKDGSRIEIDAVLATYKMPRKARRALERRRADLLAEEIAGR